MKYASRMPSGKFLGLKPDHVDHRDLAYAYRRSTRLMGPEPEKVDCLEGMKMPAIFDQGSQGSCTANAGIRWLYWLRLHFPDLFGQAPELSRQAQYYWERALPWNNDVNEDAGASSRDVFTVLRKMGSCPEEDDPYGYKNLFRDPGEKAAKNALECRIGTQHRVLTIDDLKGLLQARWCATMGILVYPSLDEVGDDGLWDPDPSREPIAGGHEVFVRGYDDKKNGGSFHIDNSWGEDYGQGGSFWLPYSFLENYSVSRWDCWTGSPIYPAPPPA